MTAGPLTSRTIGDLLNEDISSESEHKYNVMDQDAAWKMRVQVSRTHQKCLGGLLNE